MYMFARSIDFACFCNCSIRYWNFFENVVFIWFSFYCI